MDILRRPKNSKKSANLIWSEKDKILWTYLKNAPLMSDPSVRFFSSSCGPLRISELYQTAVCHYSLFLWFHFLLYNTYLFIYFYYSFIQIQQLILPFLFVLDGFPKEIFLFVFYGLQGRDLIKQACRRPLIVMLLFFKAKTPKG